MMTNKYLSLTEQVYLTDNIRSLQSSYKSRYGEELPLGLLNPDELSKKYLSITEEEYLLSNIRSIQRNLSRPADGLDLFIDKLFFWVVIGYILSALVGGLLLGW